MPRSPKEITTTAVTIRNAEPMKGYVSLPLGVNVSWNVLGTAVYALSQWAVLTVLSKLGTPEMVGQFALGLAITAPVMMFSRLQLRNVQATDTSGQYLFGDYLALRFITTVLALLVIGGIVFFAGYREEMILVILVIGSAKAFEGISDIYYGLFQQRERMDIVAKSLMIKGPLSVVALAIGVYTTVTVLWGVVGLALVWALTLGVYDCRNGAWVLRTTAKTQSDAVLGRTDLAVALRPRWSVGTLKRLTWLTLPLGSVMLLSSLYINIPVYFVERYLGERELGIFAAMAYIMVAGGVVMSALVQPAMPRLAMYYAERRILTFCSFLLKLMAIGSLSGGVGVLVALSFGPEILSFLYQPEYAEYADVFVWLMVAAGISYVLTFLTHAMIATRSVLIQLPLYAVATCTIIVTCLWLIPAYGLRGGAWALAISLFVQLLGSLMINSWALLHQQSSSRNSL